MEMVIRVNNMKKICKNEICGTEFESDHPTKVFCTKRCKHRKIGRESAQRKRDGIIDYIPIVPAVIPRIIGANGPIITQPDPVYTYRPMDESLPESFKKKYKIINDCYVWTGVPNHEYGEYNHQRAHRFSWEWYNGLIPKGLFVDHMCRTKLCVNVSHLRVVTPTINNIENSNSFSAKFKVRTHCLNGHEYSGDNFYIDAKGGNGRICRLCRHIYTKNSRNKLKKVS